MRVRPSNVLNAVLVTTVVVLLSTPVASARTVDMTASDAGGDYWFETRGQTGRNPDLVFEPGEEVWIDIRSAGREFHNIRFTEPVDNATALAPPGHSLSLRFVAPEDEGEHEYWCDPHRELGMRGTFRIASVDVEENAAPDAAIALLSLLVGLSFLKRRRWMR